MGKKNDLSIKKSMMEKGKASFQTIRIPRNGSAMKTNAMPTTQDSQPRV